MKINPKYVQLVGEAIIPLLGFFVWEWSLYFIMLFYLLDLITSEVFIQLKSKRIISHLQGGSEGRAKNTLTSILILLNLAAGIHLITALIYPGIDFIDEFIAFLSYKELGIPQGLLLIPLIAILSYQQYKMEFIMPMRYRSMTMKTLWRPHIQARLVMLLSSILIGGISLFISLPEEAYLFSVVVGVIVYQLKFDRI